MQPVGTAVQDSNLFMKINTEKDETLKWLMVEMQPKTNTEMCLTSEILSQLLTSIKTRMIMSCQGEEVPTVEDNVLAKTSVRPSNGTLQRISTEVLEEIEHGSYILA